MKRSDISESFMNRVPRSGEIIIRKATDTDINSIISLMEGYVEQGLLLPLETDDILARINSFAVAVIDDKCIGCAAIRDFGNNLYEIRSLAVNPEYTGAKTGSKLVTFLIEDSVPSEGRIFALTYRTSFFERLGFTQTSKQLFPEKIWHDCEKCPKKEHCDEAAVMMTLP